MASGKKQVRRTAARPRKRSAARRERLFDSARVEIKQAAMRHIAKVGVPSLSLRAIAKDIGLTAPALYRYFPDRDALVRALVQDAFDSFADALEAAVQAIPTESPRARLFAAGKAYRRWATENPQAYILMFGTPVPGYVKKDEDQAETGRGFGILVQCIEDVLREPGGGGHEPLRVLPGSLSARLALVAAHEVPVRSPELIALAISTWCRIHGVVSLEIYGLLPAFLADQTEAFFEWETKQSMEQRGLAREGED